MTVADPATPTQVQCSTACTVTVVHELVFPPFQLDLDEARTLFLAILAVWITGWAIRMVMKAMNTTDIRASDES